MSEVSYMDIACMLGPDPGASWEGSGEHSIIDLYTLQNTDQSYLF